MNDNRRISAAVIAPVVFGFYIFGFSDTVGFATSYVQAEFSLGETVAGLLPSMVFIWFLLLSVPTARLMNCIGRKATATIGYAVSIIGLLLPVAPIAGAGVYFAAFALIGIGNTILQVAVNPLLATLAPPEHMTGYLTMGQVARNLSLMLAAPIAAALSSAFGNWRAMFPIFAAVTLVAMVWLLLTPLPAEERSAERSSTGDFMALLRNKTVLTAFIGIALFISVDIGAGVITPKIVMERTSMTTENATLVSSVYYVCRIVGTLLGVWLLSRMSDVRWLRINMIVMTATVAAMFFVRSAITIFALCGVWGFSIACIFATLYAAATRSRPDKANEISGLMILAISSGAVIGPLMSLGADIFGGARNGALLVVALAVAGLTTVSFLLRNKRPTEK